MAQTVTVNDWDNLDKERHRLQHELDAKFKNGFLSGHPQIIAIKKQLEAVNKSLELELSVVEDRFNLEYANYLEKQRLLEAKLPEYQDATHRYAKLLKEYAGLDSGHLVYGKLLSDLSKSLETLDFGYDKDNIILEFAGHLVDPSRVVSPVAAKLLLYALIIGFTLAVAVPFLIEYLNGRISDVEHAEEVLRIRGLGVVPKVTDVSFDRLVLHDDEEKSDHHLKESFRLIRTNLVINSESGALPQVILITSSMPQEGKTCVAANLALSFASKGEKTLLIDADLRRGRVHKIFERPSKPGLSNLLSGQVALDQILHPMGNTNLTVMTCGKHLNSASELLDSNTFVHLMTELRGKYQRIIIDTPPVLGLSETIIMQRYADSVVLVIWSDFTALSSVKSALQTLQINGAKFSGFILNRLDFSALSNRYKYFYYAPRYYTNYQPLPAPANNSNLS
jgi:capsular exopolysaccharide synthesis family protein